MFKIAVLDYRLHSDAKQQIQDLASNHVVFPSARCPENEIITRTNGAEVVLVTPWEKIDKSYLEACPNIKYLGLCGTSTANIDLVELKKRGIAFSNIISGDKESVAEFFFMQLVALARGTGRYQWKLGEEHELLGRNIGIIGLGAVGQAMSHMALAFKMNVYYYSPHRKSVWEEKGLKYLNLNELLKSVEILVICSPTNVEVLGESEFAEMKPGSILVQASSGSPFSKTAFQNWVKNDNNFAIFDMSAGVSNYQLYKDYPHVIFSEVVAGDTFESNERRGQRAVENLNNYIHSPKK